jgi:transcriptional regulator with XRE-family HTH domain
MQWSKRLRQLRRAQDLTQQELGVLAGVNYTTISRIESGEAKQVYIDTAMRLAKALRVTTDELLGMVDFILGPEQTPAGVREREETASVPKWQGKRMRRTFGNELEGKIRMSDDFDAPLPEFADYR